MDPITAFSIACGVLQVVDFGTKVIVQAREIYKSGASAENKEMLTATERLNGSVETLGNWLASPSRNTSDFSREDQELETLASECSTTAKALLVKLEKLKPSNRHRVLSAVSRTLAAMREKDEIKTIQQKLENYRKIIDTKILVRLIKSTDLYAMRESEAFKLLSQQNRTTILEITSKSEQLSVQITATAAATQKRHKDDLEMIKQNQLVEQLHRDFMKSLHFPEIYARQETIPEAHRKTFQWIYEEDSAFGFVKWLREGEGTFWIKGKAGSGKSTLMNYIVGDVRTKDALAVWVGSSPQQLLTPTFFFWNAGSETQKSSLGLLRSLLFQILSECPALLSVAVAAPKGTSPTSSYAYHSPQAVTWTIPRLQATLQLMLQQNIVPLKMCFFVDGLDEFNGGQRDLLDVLTTVKNNPNVKMCVSSRPLRTLELAFQNLPSLQLQDLTKEDIRSYAVDKLEAEPAIQSVFGDQPQASSILVENLVEKSDGVFLWVKLVVADLIKGFENADTLDQLSERLDSLPLEVEGMYSHMLNKLDKVYQKQAAECFQLMISENADAADQGLSLLDFAYAQGDPLKAPLFGMSKKFSKEIFIKQVALLKIRLLALGGGLLEIHDREWVHDTPWQDIYSYRTGVNFIDHGYPDDFAYITFSHRTIRDFLLHAEPGRIFLEKNGVSKTAMYASHINTELCKISSIVGLVSQLSDEGSEEYIIKPLLNHVRECIMYARMLQFDFPAESDAMMDGINDTITGFWKSYDTFASSNWFQFRNVFCPATDFLGVAAINSYFSFVSRKIGRECKQMTPSVATNLLHCAAQGWANVSYTLDQDIDKPLCQLCRELLQKGADPNDRRVYGRIDHPFFSFVVLNDQPESSWACFVSTVCSPYFVSLGLQAKSLLGNFLECGADLNEPISISLAVEFKEENQYVTELCIIETAGYLLSAALENPPFHYAPAPSVSVIESDNLRVEIKDYAKQHDGIYHLTGISEPPEPVEVEKLLNRVRAMWKRQTDVSSTELDDLSGIYIMGRAILEKHLRTSRAAAAA